MSADAERTMRIGEIDTIGFSFYGDDLPSGVTISSGTLSVSPASGLTLQDEDAVVIGDGSALYGWVTAVTAGEYDVTFTINFSDSKTLKRVYRVTVIS